MPDNPLIKALVVFMTGLVLLLAGMTAYFYLQPEARRDAVQEAAGEATPSLGGDFTLVNDEGETVTNEDFRGQYRLMYFGYTYCPDVCPTQLTVITQALDILAETAPEKAAAVTPIFVTVDPERDTVEAMHAYVEHFHPRMVGLTGSPEQIAKAAETFKVYYRKVESEGASDYLMDHSSLMLLMGPEGDYITHYTHDVPAPEMAERLQERIAG